MALVDYSDSDDESSVAVPEPDLTSPASQTSAVSHKRKHSGGIGSSNPSGLPPLPKSFHNLYASATRVSTRDDPALHGGRKRATPHVEGNWPTHVYIEWFPTTGEYKLLDDLLSTIESVVPSDSEKIHSFLTSDLETPLPLHVSLSRPIVFPTDKKDDFHDNLKNSIESSQIHPFDFTICELDWVANFEGTRRFLVLRIKARAETLEQNDLNNLLYLSNNVVQNHGQPPLYATPRTPSDPLKRRRRDTADLKLPEQQDFTDAFHISIAWTLGTPDQHTLRKMAAQLKENKEIANKIKELQAITVRVDEVKLKIGNVVTSIPLKQHGQIPEKTLFGF